jgi:hypothetical protein
MMIAKENNQAFAYLSKSNIENQVNDAITKRKDIESSKKKYNLKLRRIKSIEK